ncbi:hypothetical protein CCICO_02505 [Corynebacterium ciconiae DSM 44920]|nr:hypothetical protein CCICO_02505 [Corynebacterium ciconiae DSM 44920]
MLIPSYVAITSGQYQQLLATDEDTAADLLME